MGRWLILPGGRVKRFKNRPSRHSCGRRRKGRPRVGYGLCYCHGVRPARAERRFLDTELRAAVRGEFRIDEIRCAAHPRGFQW